VQWERQALAGKFPRSWTTYQNDLTLRFENKEARDEAYADLERSDMRATFEICLRRYRCTTIRRS
jgi:hypothetical protein